MTIFHRVFRRNCNVLLQTSIFYRGKLHGPEKVNAGWKISKLSRPGTFLGSKVAESPKMKIFHQFFRRNTIVSLLPSIFYRSKLHGPDKVKAGWKISKLSQPGDFRVKTRPKVRKWQIFHQVFRRNCIVSLQTAIFYRSKLHGPEKVNTGWKISKLSQPGTF